MYDYNNNINFLLTKRISKESSLYEDTLNSSAFNETFKYVEDSLNILYEKIRTLEDVIEYAQSFLEEEVNNNISYCKDLIKQIENDKELRKDNSYVKFPVSLYKSNLNMKDRDEKNISVANYINDSLIASKSINKDYQIRSLIVDHNKELLYSNENQNMKNYRSIYILDSINDDYIYETLTYNLFDSDINSISLDLTNCELHEIWLYLSDGTIKVIDINELSLFKTETVSSVSITVKCKNYITSTIDKTKINSSNLMSVINELNSDENLNLSAPKYYYYIFGVDNIKIQNISIETVSGFISSDIAVGKNNDYVTLYVEDEINDGAIEYSLIDGHTEIPILPENVTTVYEKIFKGRPLRFELDDYDYIIYEYGLPIEIDLVSAINSNRDLWISYRPKIKTITINNDKIKVKAIIRNQNESNNKINKIKIKKFGGQDIWTV